MNISIAYIILGKNEQTSYFNEYECSVVKSINILKKIIDLPKDYPEIYSSKEQRISGRLSGVMNGYNVFYVNNEEQINYIKYKFKVVFINISTDLEKIDKNCILVSEDKIYNNCYTYDINELNINLLDREFKKIINNFNSSDKKWIHELKETIGLGDASECIKTGFKFPKNFYTMSNLNILKSIKVDVSITDSQEVDIKLPVNLINHVKSDIFKNIKPQLYLRSIDYYISDFSNTFKFLIDKKKYRLQALEKNNIQDARNLVKTIQYLNQGKLNCDLDNNYSLNYFSEREVIEILISLSASGHISPVLKTPIFNSKIFSKLKDIGISGRSSNEKKLINELNLYLSDIVDYFDSIYSSNIKIISNFPIEWSYHNELPLMIRHETSRIPISPGYVTTKLLLDNNYIYLKKDSFKEILFISSFNDDDPIKDDLSEKIKVIQSKLEISDEKIDDLLKSNELTKNVKLNIEEHVPINISITWKNVSNKNELIAILNKNTSAITIFDLHGGHYENGSGFIQLKDETVSIYDLIGKIKVSPIVILSSCDTSPIDRNHYTTSNAFFLAGAKTVLASALPINSNEASIFIARLLVRVQYFLPIRIDEAGKSIRWSSFITGMLRLSYYNELLNFLNKKNSFTPKTKQELTFLIDCYLDPLKDNWHNKIIKAVSDKLNISVEFLQECIKKEFIFSEVMKYIQMGNPESIIIVSEEIPTL